MIQTSESQDWLLRQSGKKYATAYAANDVHGGTAVASPPCNEDCWTSATMHMQMLATAIIRRMYLRESSVRAAFTPNRYVDSQWMIGNSATL